MFLVYSLRCSVATSFSACFFHSSSSSAGCQLPEDIREDSGPASPSAVHIVPLVQSGQAHYLSEPFEVFSFDFQKPPSIDGRCNRFSVNVTSPGRLHAVVFWWECVLAEGVTLTNSPSVDTSREHWSQAVYTVRDSFEVKEQQSVRILAAHNDLDIWFPLLYMEPQAEPSVGPQDGAPPMHESQSGLHDTYDSERFWSLADASRIELYRTALKRLSAKYPQGEYIDTCSCFFLSFSVSPFLPFCLLFFVFFLLLSSFFFFRFPG